MGGHRHHRHILGKRIITQAREQVLKDFQVRENHRRHPLLVAVDGRAAWPAAKSLRLGHQADQSSRHQVRTDEHRMKADTAESILAVIRA